MSDLIAITAHSSRNPQKLELTLKILSPGASFGCLIRVFLPSSSIYIPLPCSL